MKNSVLKITAFLIVVISSGCASVYKPINPPVINYQSHDLKDGISLSYKYDVLNEKGNRKYSKKENLKGIRVVSLKITNNTDSVINIGNDIIFYSGYKRVLPMDPIVVKNSIKQHSASYLLYFLLTPLKLYVTNSNSVETYSIGYVLGPGIALGNLALAGTSNTKLLEELNAYNILNRDIKKGETVYGIIGIKERGYNPISIKTTKTLNTKTDKTVKINEFVSLEDMYEPSKEETYSKLEKNLYKLDSDTSFESYYNKVIALAVDSEIDTIELVSETYSNGNLKAIGMKAKLAFGKGGDDIYSDSYYYKIGTWRYFYDNGQLKTLVDYNLNEKKDGRYIEYDKDGNIIKNLIFKSGEKIY